LGTKDAIARAITLRIRAAVRNSELRGHLIETEFEEPDQEADPEDELILGGRYRPLIIEPVLEDSDSYPASLSTFRPFEEMPLNWKASFQIPFVVDESSEEKATEDADSTNLGFIDSALYEAILKNPELMRSIDWRTFERLLAQVLEEFGYSIDLQRGTKDGGVDIFAIKKNGTFGIEKYLVQAKRWKAAVGVSPVRELVFLHNEYRMTKSCLATTATFTRGAWQLADLHKWSLSLKDFEGLQEWVKDAEEIRHERSFIKSRGGVYIPRK
jgi:restriction endonuclease Mrr